ncbi:MAG: Trk system potassium transporter TrkA [Lachnospiraceae bacterium]|nr:Trk system potassium transporter TrkA [Lachnospiraceae bacterium]
MKVIIVGASKVGYALARHICEEGYDLVVIDRDAACIDAITDAFDCNGFVGNGSSPELLKKAGIASATVLVAVTKDDATNILCCGVAKQLGVKRTIAAVRGPEYAEDKDFFGQRMGVDMLINPDRAAANEGNKMIRYAETVELEKFGDGNVHVATVEITKDSILAGVSMPQVHARLGAQILICAIDRGGKIFTPKGQHDVRSGDKITFAAIGEEMDKALVQLGIIEKILKKAVIVGGGKVGFYLVGVLLRQGVAVTLIDLDADHCRRMLEHYPKANVIQGDGTDSVLMEKELKDADACVACTGNDEGNLIISMFAKSFGLDRIAAVIDNFNYEVMLKKSGINHIFSTQDVALIDVIKDTRLLATAGKNENDKNVMKWLYTLNGGKIEAAEFEISEDFAYLDMPFKEKQFQLKSGILIAVIMRGQEVIVPDGNSCIKVGDHVIVVSAEHKIARLSDIFAKGIKEN